MSSSDTQTRSCMNQYALRCIPNTYSIIPECEHMRVERVKAHFLILVAYPQHVLCEDGDLDARLKRSSLCLLQLSKTKEHRVGSLFKKRESWHEYACTQDHTP